MGARGHIRVLPCDPDLGHKADGGYLLIQRKNPPNQGKWSFPGGKLNWGETILEGGQRELAEEVIFQGEDVTALLQWYPRPFSTADSIGFAENQRTVEFHYVVVICFAELTWKADGLPSMIPYDDAADAKWWSMDELLQIHEEQKGVALTPGLVDHIVNAELLYEKGLLSNN